jgi:gamma-glutamyltranspeptidase/glutathione hydrolase
MVATSQPQATLSAIEVLREGGNAIDAALCAAAVQCVAEPYATGIGGDLFAIVRHADGSIHGLDAAGPAPRAATPEPPATTGPRSVTVPGAVAGWAELSSRFGRLGLDRCLRPAIELARRGVAAGFECSTNWGASAVAPSAFGPPPRFGQPFQLGELGATLELIAARGPDALYRGPVADAIVSASWLDPDDLTAYQPRWVQPLARTYRGVTVSELPPPTQGVAALEALAILGDRDPTLADEVRAVSLALEDAFNHVRDGADVSGLLSEEHILARREHAPAGVGEPPGGTTYLCVVDGERTAVSLIQSVFESFGSGVLVGSTGIVLHNRAACFAVQGDVVPGQRPYHTLLPGMLTRDSDLVGPFGVMGGFIQAQAHVQFLVELVRNGFDPQAALDRGRFRVDGEVIRLEPPLWDRAAEIQELGFTVERDPDVSTYGGGQAIVLGSDGTLFGGSDARKDGVALGF